MSTRRKPQAPNRARANVANIYVLFLGPAESGRVTQIGGAYTSQHRAESAEARVRFPHDYEIVRIPADMDMFPDLGEVNMTRVDDDDQDDGPDSPDLDDALDELAAAGVIAGQWRPRRNPLAWAARRFGRAD